MKKTIITLLACIITMICFGQANTYFHDRIDTTIFAVTDTAGHGSNNYYATNLNSDFNVKQYINGLSVILFVKKGNTGSSTLTLITKTGTLNTKTIRKGSGQILANGDLKDSTIAIFTFYNGSWRLGSLLSASVTSWLLTGNSGTNPSLNFIGTTNDVDFITRTNSVERGRFGSTNTLKLTGSGNTQATSQLYCTNSDAMTTFKVRGDGMIVGGNPNTNSLVFTNSPVTSANMGNGNVMFGVNNFLSEAGGIGNSGFGSNVLTANTSGQYNTAIGNGALYANTSGQYNTAIGFATLEVEQGGNYMTAIGAFAGDEATSSAGEMVAVGYRALRKTTGEFNVAVGSNTLAENTTGRANTAVGWYTLQKNTTGIDNTGVGEGVLFGNTTGNSNTVIGENAMTRNNTGSGNVVIGAEALYVGEPSVISSAQSNNTVIGTNALASDSSAVGMVVIGYGACDTCKNMSNKLWIANATGLPLVYGDFITKKIGIGTTSPLATMDISGFMKLLPQSTPSSPIEGMIYADSSDHHLYFYNGTNWKQLDN